MKLSLRTKLIASFLIVAASAIFLVALLVGNATAAEFGQYVVEQEGSAVRSSLAELYEEQGGWDELSGEFGPRLGPGHGMGEHMPPMGMSNGAFAVVDTEGRVVLPGAGLGEGQQVGPELMAAGMPIEADGEVIGALIHPRHIAPFLSPAGQQFLTRVNRVLVIAGFGAAVLALVLGAGLAGRLTASLQELKEGTQAVAAGDLGRQVIVRSGDEIGELATSFNQMSADLARLERVRRQMTADIAHELRTPLSLMLGHAEALSDGVLPWTEDNIRVIHDEATRLNRIVEDLRTLSLVEAGELSLSPRQVDPAKLAQAVISARQSASLEMRVQAEGFVIGELPTIEVDPDRIQQALGNVVDNALRHTPPGGQVRVKIMTEGDHVKYIVEDTGPGLSAEDLPLIFDRFYRADHARSRDQGGSGLGLAIAKSLVEAHGGRLWAENQSEGGARFVLDLPSSSK